MNSGLGLLPNEPIKRGNFGKNTRIWQYVVILPGAVIGDDCNICSHCFIENDVIIGNRVTVKSGVQLWDGLRVADEVFIGPNVSFANDRFPRSKQRPERFLNTYVERGASIGAGAVILPGITIGRMAMVAAGSVVTRSVPPFAMVSGNPARIVKYLGATESDAEFPAIDLQGITKRMSSKVPGVYYVRMRKVVDPRGSLTVAQLKGEIPFDIKRVFMVFDVPSYETRGEHAHRACHQFLICPVGSCAVVVDDGMNREEYHLNRPDVGIHIPPMIWGIQYKYTLDALLLVLASELYDPSDYIRDYSDFLKVKGVS
ncbi:MAG: isomerase [Actinobacteria bacterium]|nr:isomerase [Actinomycetota bacterium]